MAEDLGAGIWRELAPKGTEMLRFKGEQGKTGFKSYGFHNVITDGKRKPGKGRGATQVHDSFAEAQKAVDKAVEKAVALGWVKQAKKAGGPKPDPFDLKSMPAPGKQQFVVVVVVRGAGWAVA